MRVSQVDLAQRVIRLEPGTTKNREGREVVMTDAVFALLGVLVEGKDPSDYVFTRGDGSVVKDFRKTWQNARRVAGAPKLLFHDLRRTGARICAALVSRRACSWKLAGGRLAACSIATTSSTAAIWPTLYASSNSMKGRWLNRVMVTILVTVHHPRCKTLRRLKSNEAAKSIGTS
jgi:integrase